MVPAWASLADEERRILLVLDDHPVGDPSGRAVARLQPELGVDNRKAVSAAVVRLEGRGLLSRHGNSARTYRISSSGAGSACVAQGWETGAPRIGPAVGSDPPAG